MSVCLSLVYVCLSLVYVCLSLVYVCLSLYIYVCVCPFEFPVTAVIRVLPACILLRKRG